MPDLAPYETHAIFNQSPPHEDVDLFWSDRPLHEAVVANGGAGEVVDLQLFGRHWGSETMMATARLADENVPRLHAFDAKGYRRDIATAALVESGGPIAAMFARCRLATRRSATYGTAPLDARAVALLIDRALPA